MRLSARAKRLKRVAGALPDPDAFARGLEKMLKPFEDLDDSPIEWEPSGLMKPRKKPAPMEPLTREERQALEAEGCDSLAGFLGWAMRQEEDEACD